MTERLSRLDINIGFLCNNNCIFCLGNGPRPYYTPPEVAVREISRIENPERVELNILGGEPTVYPYLDSLILEARRLGFASIGIVTNGRRLSDASYLKKLIALGLTRVTISIHAPTRRVSETITRVPGSFQETVEGIKNCARARREGLLGARLSTHTVICKQNISLLTEMAAFLSSMGVEEQVYSFITPLCRADENFRLVVPRMSDAAMAAIKMIDENPRANIRLLDFPLCVLKGRESLLANARNTSVEVWQLPTKSSHRKETREKRFYHDQVRVTEYKTKTKKCEQCRASPYCEGVFKRYVEEYGDGELEPY